MLILLCCPDISGIKIYDKVMQSVKICTKHEQNMYRIVYFLTLCVRFCISFLYNLTYNYLIKR